MNDLVTIDSVKSRMIAVRGQTALLDRDVAEFYGVETRMVNQAVRNNPDKFPEGYVIVLDKAEVEVLRSKFLTLEQRQNLDDLRSKILIANVGLRFRVCPMVFTERGRYRITTILKSDLFVHDGESRGGGVCLSSDESGDRLPRNGAAGRDVQVAERGDS